MSDNFIDSMIEEWASTSEAEKKVARNLAETKQVGAGDQGDLANISFSKPQEASEDPAPTPGLPPAAQALLEALRASGELSVWAAKGVAKEALGISRIGAKRWAGILASGPFVEVDGKVRLLEESPKKPKPKRKSRAVSEPNSKPPKNWMPATVLACGHRNWLAPRAEDRRHEKAREAGFCCYEAQAAKKRGLRTGLSVDWTVRGLTHPVPQRARRSIERSHQPGFPGLCCSKKTGLYIGGLGNDCRNNPNTKEKCEVHGG